MKSDYLTWREPRLEELQIDALFDGDRDGAVKIRLDPRISDRAGRLILALIRTRFVGEQASGAMLDRVKMRVRDALSCSMQDGLVAWSPVDAEFVLTDLGAVAAAAAHEW